MFRFMNEDGTFSCQFCKEHFVAGLAFKEHEEKCRQEMYDNFFKQLNNIKDLLEKQAEDKKTLSTN